MYKRIIGFWLMLLVALTLTLPHGVVAKTIFGNQDVNATSDDDSDSDDEDEDDDSDDDEDSDDEDEDDDSDDDEDSDDDDEDDDSDDDEDSDDEDKDDDSDDDEDSDDDDEDDDSDDDEDSDDEDDSYGLPAPVAPEGSQFKVSLERSLLGTLSFEVDLRGVPVGLYDLLVNGTKRGTIDVQTKGNSTRGELEFDEAPEGDDLLLNFEILGQLIEVTQDSIVWFSLVAPGTASVSDDESDVEEDKHDGSISSSTDLSPTTPEEDVRVRVKYEREYDGELVLEIEAEGLPAGDYRILIAGVYRGQLSVQDHESGTYGETEYESDPDSADELLLDFNVSGEQIQLLLGDEILFEGTIPILVADPVEPPSSESYISVAEPLLPDPTSEQLPNGFKDSDWFGVYDDTLYPIIEHCVLGRIEYRFDSQRNIIVSEKYGALEILRDVSSGDYVYYSFETGRIFSISKSTADCTVLDPETFVDEEDERFNGIFPDADDPEGFYHLAFEATQTCQIKASETIEAVQQGNRTEALEELSETAFYRELAVNNANRVKQAAAIEGSNVEFWNEAADHLINVASEALMNAQFAVASM